MGLPGAGKGFVKGRRYLRHTGFKDIDPDEIKKLHPNYDPDSPNAGQIHEWSSIEAARQLRGESTSQVKDARLAVAHGNGGMLGARHCAGTVILGRD